MCETADGPSRSRIDVILSEVEKQRSDLLPPSLRSRKPSNAGQSRSAAAKKFLDVDVDMDPLVVSIASSGRSAAERRPSSGRRRSEPRRISSSEILRLRNTVSIGTSVGDVPPLPLPHQRYDSNPLVDAENRNSTWSASSATSSLAFSGSGHTSSVTSLSTSSLGTVSFQHISNPAYYTDTSTVLWAAITIVARSNKVSVCC